MFHRNSNEPNVHRTRRHIASRRHPTARRPTPCRAKPARVNPFPTRIPGRAPRRGWYVATATANSRTRQGATNGRFQKNASSRHACMETRDGWRSNDPRDANGMGACDACATMTRFGWGGRRDAAMRAEDARGSAKSPATAERILFQNGSTDDVCARLIVCSRSEEIYQGVYEGTGDARTEDDVKSTEGCARGFAEGEAGRRKDVKRKDAAQGKLSPVR